MTNDNAPLRVSIVFEFPTLHGGERSLLAAIDELRRTGDDVAFTAFAPARGPLAEALAARGIEHWPWSMRDEHGERRRAGEAEAELREGLSTLVPDVIHANSLAMGRVLGRLHDRLASPTTVHLRDIVGLSAAAIAALNRNARLIAVSEATRAFHVSQGLDAARTTVIYNGVDLHEFQPRPKTGELHRELGVPPACRLVAAIGQIGLRKGWDVLAEAVPIILATMRDVHFVFVGARHSNKPESRRYEADVKRRLQEAGVANRVHWVGERSDVNRLLNEIELLVHAAHQEPLGRVLIEALASGAPIIATDVGGTREIIEPELSGRLIAPRDSSALAAAAVDVLSNACIARRFRQESRLQAERQFDVRESARRLAALWCEVVSGG
jgi:glycosyltransferase involved in cell wall biosynthesis